MARASGGYQRKLLAELMTHICSESAVLNGWEMSMELVDGGCVGLTITIRAEVPIGVAMKARGDGRRQLEGDSVRRLNRKEVESHEVEGTRPE